MTAASQVQVLVRLDADTAGRLARVARAHGVNRVDVVRAILDAELPTGRYTRAGYTLPAVAERVTS